MGKNKQRGRKGFYVEYELKPVEKNKKVFDDRIFIAMIIFMLAVILIGGSYAFVRLNLSGTKGVDVTVGTFSIDFSEGNSINMTNAKPQTDTEGLTNTPYTFTIGNTGNVSADYIVKLELDDANEIQPTLIKYSYKKDNGTYSTPVLLSSTNTLVIASGNLNAGLNTSYELKLWIDSSVGNEAQNKTFKAKLVVEATQTNLPKADTTKPIITLNGEISTTIEQNSTYTDPGVKSVSDNKDTLSISNVTKTYEYYNGTTTTTVSSVDTSKIGVYYITYHIKDSNNNEGLVIRSVSVYKKDTTAPVITLSGNSSMSINMNQDYIEPGATATDNIDGDISTSIIVQGTVNTSMPGVYQIKYLVTDSIGNTVSVLRTVTVVYVDVGTINVKEEYTTDTTVKLTATSTKGVITGYKFTTSDIPPTEFESITSNTATIEKNEIITEDVVYYAWFKDSKNNIKSHKTISDKLGPTITLLGDNPMNLTKSATYTEPGYKVVDNKDVEIKNSEVTQSYEYLSGITSQTLTQANVPTINDANYPWTQTSGVWKSSGNYHIANSTSNLTMQFTLTASTTLSFDWSVSSEGTSWDYLYYTITKDCTTMSGTGTSTKIGGTSYGTVEDSLTYTTITKTLEAGTYTLVFTYRKNSSTDGGLDAGFVKNIDFGGATALFSTVTTVSNINTANVGTYYIHYTAKDSANNESTVTRTVNVSETGSTPPTITLNGSKEITLNERTAYTDQGATAVDSLGNDISSSVFTSGNVDNYTPGVYEITYSVKDSNGVLAAVTRTVTVTTAPTYTATYEIGDSNVTAIGSTMKSCKVYGTNISCTVTATSITAITGYTGFWTQDKTASSGTSASSSITLTKNTTYYAKASDITKPIYSLSSASLSNNDISTTPNSTDVATIVIDATDTTGTVTSTLTADNITVKVGTTTVTPTTKTLSSATNITNGKQYTLTLSGFTGLGVVSIVIDASTLTDPSSNANVSTSITTGLEVYTPLRGTVDNLVSSDYVGAYGAINTSDSDQTFITGTNPNNYIWYSGKLWRAVSKDTSDNSVKLVTQWAISSIPYNVSDNTAFSGSHAQMWLNDTASDGFLGTLYNYSNYIKSSSWNATLTTATTKPATTTMVTNYVGLLNIYEYYKASYTPNSTSGYLNDGLLWWTLTPYSSSNVRNVNDSGNSDSSYAYKAYGLRPSVNLKSSITITGGTGTEIDPYLLAGDDTAPATNTLLNTRRSGEYITFGDGVNNLYRIVNVENSKTKIVSAIPLKSGTSYITKAFSTSSSYVTYTNNSNYTLAYYLNNDYLNTANGFLTSSQVSMIDTNQTWYTGTVASGANYNLGKCTTAGINCTKNAVSTTATVGLLRLGEQLAGQFDRYGNNTYYWTLTPYSSSSVWNVHSNGISDNADASIAYGLWPSVNLKSTIKIISGKGTKQEPFTISE